MSLSSHSASVFSIQETQNDHNNSSRGKNTKRSGCSMCWLLLQPIWYSLFTCRIQYNIVTRQVHWIQRVLHTRTLKCWNTLTADWLYSDRTGFQLWQRPFLSHLRWSVTHRYNYSIYSRILRHCHRVWCHLCYARHNCDQHSLLLLKSNLWNRLESHFLQR